MYFHKGNLIASTFTVGNEILAMSTGSFLRTYVEDLITFYQVVVFSFCTKLVQHILAIFSIRIRLFKLYLAPCITLTLKMHGNIMHIFIRLDINI